jgi:ATP-dependent Clp endopeptidase proteolytic subunit ClpP
MTNAEPVHPGFGLKEQIQLAMIEKLRAETARINTETEQHKQYIKQAKANTRIAEINLETEEFTHKARLANDYHHHTLPLTGPIDAALVNLAISQLTTWSRTDPGCEVTIYLNSPGGGMTYGFALFDFIRSLQANGHTINIVVIGMAASMASVLLQAASDGGRKMGREAWLMIHEATFGAGGKMGEIEDVAGWVKASQERILDIYAERSKGKKSKAQFRQGWNRKDWWISSDEALKFGLVDEII